MSTPEPGVLLFEAATAEAALEAVHAEVGAGAEILSAERTRSGGLGGFFAREVVQLRVRARETAAAQPAAAPPAPAQPAAAEEPRGLEALLAGLVAEEDSEERTFADVLRARLEIADAHQQAPAEPAAPVATPPAVALPVAAPPAVAVPVAAPAASTQPVLPSPEPGSPQVDWSITNLQRLGLPVSLLEGLRGLDPRDDAAWVAGLAHAVATLARPLPAGPAAYVGPRAAKLAATLHVPVVTVGTEAEPERPFAVAMQGGEAARSWLAWARGRRWLHVVAGGEGWRPLLFDEPLAVSWVGEEHLCEAIRLCSELGLVLGYGLGRGRGAKARRAAPLEIALAIRDLLPVR